MTAPPPVIVTIDQVRATARDIVNQEGTRRAIGVSVHHILAMAHTVCALDDIARLSAEYLTARDAMVRAEAGDAGAERAADDRRAQIEADLHAGLTALGFLSSPEQEKTDERAQ